MFPKRRLECRCLSQRVVKAKPVHPYRRAGLGHQMMPSNCVICEKETDCGTGRRVSWIPALTGCLLHVVRVPDVLCKLCCTVGLSPWTRQHQNCACTNIGHDGRKLCTETTWQSWLAVQYTPQIHAWLCWVGRHTQPETSSELTMVLSGSHVRPTRCCVWHASGPVPYSETGLYCQSTSEAHAKVLPNLIVCRLHLHVAGSTARALLCFPLFILACAHLL